MGPTIRAFHATSTAAKKTKSSLKKQSKSVDDTTPTPTAIKPRGRPRKVVVDDLKPDDKSITEALPKKRGRPKKIITPDQTITETTEVVAKKKVGRPKKIVVASNEIIGKELLEA